MAQSPKHPAGEHSKNEGMTEDWRTSQLGLPFLLVTRRDADAALLDAALLHECWILR
jgi:hypothetical protein